MNSALDILFLRRPRLRYVSPGVCEASFSGSGTPLIVLDALARGLGPTGLILGGSGGFQLSWNNYPGALCFSVYKAVDELDPFGAYVLIAECITDNFIDLESFGPGTYRVTAITEEGESDPSEPIVVEGAGSVVVTVIADPDATSPYGGEPGKFIISKEGFHNTNLTVNFIITGTAENGVDYTAIASSAVIAVGTEFVEVFVSALLEPNDPESPETVIMTLTTGGFYIVGTPGEATVTIQQCPPEVGIGVPADTEGSAEETLIGTAVMQPFEVLWTHNFGPVATGVYEVRYIEGAFQTFPAYPDGLGDDVCGFLPGRWKVTGNYLRVFADGVIAAEEIGTHGASGSYDPVYVSGSQAASEAVFAGRIYEVSGSEIELRHNGDVCADQAQNQVAGSPNPTFELWKVASAASELLVLPANIRIIEYDSTIFDPLQCPDAIGASDPQWDGTLASVIQVFNTHIWQSAAAREINNLSLVDVRVEFSNFHPTSTNGRGWNLAVTYRTSDSESNLEGWFGWKGVGDSPVGLYYRASGCHLEPACIAIEETP